MSAEPLSEFLIARSSGGDLGGLPGLLRYYSKEFRRHVADGNSIMMSEMSNQAWGVIQALAFAIRGAQDAGRLSLTVCPNTGSVVKDATIADATAMIANAKVDKKHPNFGSLALRDCFNKLIHAEHATYRIDGRGSHFQITSGPDQNPRKGPWVAEIRIARFADDCEATIKMLP